MKHLLSIADLSRQDILDLVELALKLKNPNRGFTSTATKYSTLLKGKTLGIIMEKPSTRTTISFAVAMYQLGGLPIILSSSELQRKRGETLADTARTLSRYLSAISFRTFSHNDIVEFAKHSTIPVINALTDLEHPCQVLGDILTIIEKKSEVRSQRSETSHNRIEKLKNLKFVFIGDGNNVANSLMLLCAKLSLDLTVITPPGYEPDKDIFDKLTKEISRSSSGGCKSTNNKIIISNNLEDVAAADVIYTDVWTSMGKDDEREKRLKFFKRYQVNSALISKTKPNCIIMHCLPARRGEEITDKVIDGPNSVVFDQAENRLHIQKAILLKLLKGYSNPTEVGTSFARYNYD